MCRPCRGFPVTDRFPHSFRCVLRCDVPPGLSANVNESFAASLVQLPRTSTGVGMKVRMKMRTATAVHIRRVRSSGSQW